MKKSGPLGRFFISAFLLLPMTVIYVFRSFILGNNKFSVVVWPDGGTCVVATKWLDKLKKNVIYPTQSKCPTRLVMSLMEAQEDWEECNVEFLHSYKTFNLANKAAILAAEGKPIDSNVETDYEKPRKHQLPIRFTETSDDDDWELEHICKKRKRQVIGRSCREMQRTKKEERKNCQNISERNSVPAPAVNIREQLAAMKAQISHPIKALNRFNSNTKVSTTKKPMKAINNTMSPKKSPAEEILISYNKSTADTRNANVIDVTTTRQDADFAASDNLLQSPLHIDDVTSDLEMLFATQTSSISTFSPIMHEGERKQDEIFQSSEEHSDNDVTRNVEEHRPVAQQNGGNRKNLLKVDNIKSPLEGCDNLSRKKEKRNGGSTDITSTITENIVKVQEEIRVKLDHLEVKLDRIINKLFPEEIKLNRPHGIPAFPLRAEEEWEKLEDVLSHEDVFIYVVDVLAAKMKNKESEIAAMQSVLPTIITNSFSRVISWKGTKKSKIAFNKSKLYEATQAAILQKFGTTADLQKPEDYVKRWFSTSAQRVV